MYCLFALLVTVERVHKKKNAGVFTLVKTVLKTFCHG